jgi:hypothetical protein
MRRFRNHLITGLALLAFCLPLGAATITNPIFPQVLKNTQTCFIQGTDSAGTYKTIYTGDADGSKIIGIYAGTNDDVSHLLTVRYSTSTSDHCATNGTCGSGAAATLAASSGYANGTPVVGFLNTTVWPGAPLDSDGNSILYLTTSTTTLEATFATAFSTAGEHVCVNVIGIDF